MRARIALSGVEVSVDLRRPISLAMPIDFSGHEARHFGAPLPSAKPFTTPGFCGAVISGASCNCATITLTPHCNGTHTECVAHLTGETLNAHEVIPPGLLAALLISITPIESASSTESTEPAPQPGDCLITRKALEQAWPKDLPATPSALVVRIPHAWLARAPYLSKEAATLLVERTIEHLVVELASIDRGQDEGRLMAHRVFFGLPRGSHALSQAQRPQCTVTEFARIPAGLTDGFYLLELRGPAIGGDAVPSRPLLYPIEAG